MLPSVFAGLLLAMPMAFAEAAQAAVPVAAAVSAAAATPAAAPAVGVVTDAQMQNEIDDLEALQRGDLPTHFPLPALFEIDLGDESAVARRVEELRQRLAAASQPGAATVLRDRLRLQFLQMPADVRAPLLERDRQHQERLALDEQRAADAKRQAAAEEARQAAIQDAQEASHAAERELAIETARLQSYRAELAALAQSWNGSNQTDLDGRAQRLVRYQPANVTTGYTPEEADRLYRQIRDDLHGLRLQAAARLDALDSPSKVPAMEHALDLSAPRFAPLVEQRRLLEQLRVQTATERAQLQQREAEDRYRDAENVMRGLGALQVQRIQLLQHLSPERRQAVSGFTADGLNRVRDEIRHVTLMARWYPQQRRHEIAELPENIRDVFTVGQLGIKTLLVVVLLIAYSWALRRNRDWISYLRSRVVELVPYRALAYRLHQLLSAIGSLAPELLFLGLVFLLFDRLWAGALEQPELRVLRELAYIVAWYRLILAFVHRLLLNAVQRYRRVDARLNERILRSVRWVGRLGLVVTIYLTLSEALLGRGALYGFAQSLAWIGAAILAYRLIRLWREDVTTTYLRLYPEGRLAAAVRGSSNRTHGLLVAVLAFAFVAARGLWSWLRDTALGFEQTRKALAYLMRRRLEKQAEREGGRAGDTVTVPEALAHALSEEAAPADLRIPHFPEQERVIRWAESVAQSQRGGLVALVGDRGIGKTTWLQTLAERRWESLAVLSITLDRRLLRGSELVSRLAQVIDQPVTDESGLVGALRAGPPRLMLMDLGQNLMLRAVDALEAYEAFLRIAQATADRVLWVMAISRWPFEFMQRLHPDQSLFDHVIRLSGWSERQIAELIETRMQAAGYEAVFSDLQLDLSLSSRRGGVVETDDDLTLEQTEQPCDRYYRILWDYADGNPRVALHFWRQSLVPKAPKQVRVRLFAAPSQAGLDTLPLDSRLLLAALVQHENLSASAAARSLRQPEAQCAAVLSLLKSQGILIEQQGAYRVDSHWNRAVLRFLQRQKLLVI